MSFSRGVAYCALFGFLALNFLTYPQENEHRYQPRDPMADRKDPKIAQEPDSRASLGQEGFLHDTHQQHAESQVEAAFGKYAH